MGRRRKKPVRFRLDIRFVPASEEDEKQAISALALMYRNVMLRNPRLLAALRSAENPGMETLP